MWQTHMLNSFLPFAKLMALNCGEKEKKNSEDKQRQSSGEEGTDKNSKNFKG